MRQMAKCSSEENELLRRLAEKSLTTKELFGIVERDFSLLPTIMTGISSQKATVRYGCAKVLLDLSEEYPEKLYPCIDSFIDLLENQYRVLIWNAMAIIANLARVDRDKKFDLIFDRYYRFLKDEYMVTVANVVGNSGKIAVSKPYLADKIAGELLKVESISTTPHLTEECKRVIAEKTIKSLNIFFDKISNKDKVLSFVQRQKNSSRKTLREEAENFIKRQG